MSVRSLAPGLSCLVFIAAGAQGQALPALSVESIEDAAEQVDFPRVVQTARAVLEAGALTPRELARAHQLLAAALSFQGDDDGARTAYARMLAADPTAQPDATVPPRLQGPFHAARAAGASLGADVSWVGPQITIRVHDPLDLVVRAEVYAMPPVGGDPVLVLANALEPRGHGAQRVEAPAGDPDAAEGNGKRVVGSVDDAYRDSEGVLRYFVRLRDGQHSTWWSFGTADAPRAHLRPRAPYLDASATSPQPAAAASSAVASPAAVPSTVGSSTEASPTTHRRAVRSAWLWAAVGVVVVSVGVAVPLAMRGRDVRAVTSVRF